MNFTKRSTAPSVPECHKVDPLTLNHVTFQGPSKRVEYPTAYTRYCIQIECGCVWVAIDLGDCVTSPKTKVAPSDRHEKPIDLERGSISLKSIPIGWPIQL
jgi:hypothetical protein